jgi:hypothetical protein
MLPLQIQRKIRCNSCKVLSSIDIKTWYYLLVVLAASTEINPEDVSFDAPAPKLLIGNDGVFGSIARCFNFKVFRDQTRRYYCVSLVASSNVLSKTIDRVALDESTSYLGYMSKLEHDD